MQHLFHRYAGLSIKTRDFGACSLLSRALSGTQKMNRGALRDLDVAHSIQARTEGSGGGYKSKHATQERDPSPALGQEKNPTPPSLGEMPGMDQSCRRPAHPRVFGSLMFTAGPTVIIRERCA